MRIQVKGNCTSARALRDMLRFAGRAVVERNPAFTVEILESKSGAVTFDSVDCALETEILRYVRELTSGPVLVKTAGGNQRDDMVRIVLPAGNDEAARAVELGVFRGLSNLLKVNEKEVEAKIAEAKFAEAKELEPKKSFWRRVLGRLGLLGLILVLLGAAGSVQAQEPSTSSTGAARMNLTKLGGVTLGGANVVDAGNTAFRVNCVVGCGSSSFVDNSAFTAGTSAILNIGAVFNDGLGAVTSGNAAAPRITSSRALHVNLRDNSGVALGVAAAPLFSKVSDGTDIALVSGSGSLQVTCDNCGGSTFADNSAFTFGTTPVLIGAGVLDDTAPNAATENSAAAWRISANRNLYFQLRDGAGNERGANVTASNALQVDGSAVVQPVSGAVTANAGTNLNTSALALDATVTNRLPAGSTPADNESNAITASRLGAFNYIFDGTTWDRWQGVVTIGGTLPAYASTPTMNVGTFPDNEPFNVAQFGGSAVVTGTGTGGAGIPRVTISNDSSLAANQSVNLAQVGATTVVNGGLAGSQSIGGTAANNAAINQNPLLVAVEALSSQPAAATTGNQRRLVGSLDGAIYTREGGPIKWRCALNNLAATLTQCQAAPGASLSLYITDVTVQTTTTTSGTYAIQAGTGTNCGTGTTALFPMSAAADRWNAPITTQSASNFKFTSPIVVAANNAVCVIGVATNTIRIQLHGYTAP